MVRSADIYGFKGLRLKEIGLILAMCLNFNLIAQVEVSLTIENQTIVGAVHYFDIYLTRSSNVVYGDLYLGNADFVIAFDETLFNNPTLSKVNLSPGNCTFQPIISNPTNDLITQVNYFDNSAVMVTGNLLVINLNGPTPGDQNTFDARVAQIDDVVSKHRLGSFKITGLLDPNYDADLKWKTVGLGLKTVVLTLENSYPFMSNQVDLQTDTNTCPESMTIVESPISSGHYQAEIQLVSEATAQNSATITLSAGDNLVLNPNFEVPLGTTLLMNIQGCE